MVWASSCFSSCSALFVPHPVSMDRPITSAASTKNRRRNVFVFIQSFPSQLLGSCRSAAKLLWITGRTSPPTRVCAVKPVHGNDAAIFACFLFCGPEYYKKALEKAYAQHDRNIKLFYHYYEGFSTKFHIYLCTKATHVRFLCVKSHLSHGKNFAFLKRCHR